MTVILAAVVGVALACAGGCTTPTNWREFQHDAPFGDLWAKFVRVAGSNGYLPDPRETDRGERRFVSRWREMAAPFRHGKRLRLHGEFQRSLDVTGWTLRLYVERQSVKDISKGFDPEELDWKTAGQEDQAEVIIINQMRSSYGQDIDIEPGYAERR